MNRDPRSPIPAEQAAAALLALGDGLTQQLDPDTVHQSTADEVVDAAADWSRFEHVCLAHSSEEWRRNMATENLAILNADAGKHIGIARVVATKL